MITRRRLTICCLLLVSTGASAEVLDQPTDLSFDGKRILFAYAQCQGDRKHRAHTDHSRGHWPQSRCYHVFKVNVDGTALEQLTGGTFNDFDPCWLPNGRIIFNSERCGGYLRCGRVCPTYVLHDMGLQIPGTNSVNIARAVLGTVPVEADGSAHFIVPARKDLFSQALDADGLAVTTMRSGTQFMPGEKATCQGCHEPTHTAIVATSPLAMRRPPSRLEADVDGTNPFSYPRLVQPVLDKHCVKCHAQSKKPDKPNSAARSLAPHWNSPPTSRRVHL